MPTIKCLICRKRTETQNILKGFTCITCTDFLTKNGHEYKDGESYDKYTLRLSEVLNMKIGA